MPCIMIGDCQGEERRGEATMIVQSACAARSTEDFSRPNCPRCGSVLLIAEQSQFNARGHIDHVWSCDECGNEFSTSIKLWTR
jgi:RNase P subunit RPR2